MNLESRAEAAWLEEQVQLRTSELLPEIHRALRASFIIGYMMGVAESI